MIWTIEDALILIRKLQPLVHKFDYHILLGGGVLNKGVSKKDLDLYCIPFSEKHPDPAGMRALFQKFWGEEYNLGGPAVSPWDVDVAYPDEPTWVNGRYTYRIDGFRRIDVFIA